MPRGEKRAGGRPQGAATALTRRKADEISRSGRSPLDVMMNNMYFWFDHAVDLSERIEVELAEIKELDASEKADGIEKIKPLLKNLLAARENAQGCAVDAAPYVHPRLASIAFKKPGEKKVVITAALPEPRGDDEDRSYREGYDGDNVTSFPAKKLA